VSFRWGGSSNAQSAPGTTFLRGIQKTDHTGMATFRTIYPGWYMGRAVHIHVKVELADQTVHTGQLFFRDSLTEAVYRSGPYSARPGPDVTNEADSIYRQAGGSAAIPAMKRQGSGYVGSITMGVRP
jgi:protocatechuate 3,4-dioxygenase beta subunit